MVRGRHRWKRPEDLQGYGSRYRGQKTIDLQPRASTPEQEAERERAIDIAIAQIERQFAGTGRILGGEEQVSPAKSEVAQLKPRDERGRFLPVEGEKIVASERKPRKRAGGKDLPPEPVGKPKRRRRKSQATIIRAEMRAQGL